MDFKLLCPVVLLTVFMGAMGCDTIMTETPPAGDDFETPFEGMSHDLNAAFAAGDENFERAFTVEEGLGPIFNNSGCEGCHPGDGRGSFETSFFRFSRGPDLALNEGGAQHQDKAIPGVDPEDVPEGVDRSRRLPPPVFGVGLIGAIPEDTIVANEDPEDADNDGISGRAHWVTAPAYVSEAHVGGGSGPQLGRFSRKAQVSSLLQQIAEAYQQDMGITSDFIPEENSHPQAGGVAIGDRVPDPEIPASTVLETVMYVRLLSPPARGEEPAEVKQGETLFASIKCASCHIPTMMTGPNSIPQLDRTEVNLYSDLLLHDMGSELADNRPDGNGAEPADGQEWRTTPLWGLRVAPDFLGGEAFYLHDGRTTSLHEAIRAHGGEAEESRAAYMGLSESEQQALIAFLESL